MVSTIACGLMSYGYLWAISTHSVPLAIVFSLVMWGAVYQLNAVFPAFYPEQIPAKNRVSGMAISQNLGTVASRSAMVLVSRWSPDRARATAT